MKYLLVVFVFLAGCATQPVPVPDDPKYAPVQPAALMPPVKNDGSIYQPGFSSQLWSDQRARRVGDVITIVLEESTSSSKSNKTNITKDASVDMDAPTILGTSPRLKAHPLFQNSASTLTLENNIDAEREFSGAAGADQSNSLSGSITVTVSEVLPNGLLRVRGEKWLSLSRGEEFIRITGLVRNSDVQPDNTILSTRVADARITYSGTGDLANSGKIGWLSRFFNSPYWPF